MSIDELIALEAKAAPAPWSEDDGEGYSIWSIYAGSTVIARVIGDSAETDATAHAIVALRNVAPELLAVAKAVEEEHGQRDHEPECPLCVTARALRLRMDTLI